MHEVDLILTLTGGLAAALVCGVIAHRFRLSPIVGYLVGGILVGPHTPGFIANQGLSDQLAEVGVILLMFGVGLHFHLEYLIAVKRTAILGAIGQVVVATALGTGIGLASGWGLPGGIVFGLAISVASTVVLLRLLEDNQALANLEGRLAVGWLVVEDLLTVLALVLLPNLATGESFGAVSMAVLAAVGKLGLMLLLTATAGKSIIPWVIERADRTGSRELFTLTVLVVALGVAVGAAKLFGLSMPLGAFLAGMVVGRTEHGSRAAAEALPLRDAFSVLFFVSIGMLFDPACLVHTPMAVAATTGVVVLAKPLVACLILALLGHPAQIAFSVALALAQIGEFSFILGSLGLRLGMLDRTAGSVLVAASVVSITLNPALYRLAPRLERWTHRLKDKRTRQHSLEPVLSPTPITEDDAS